MSFDRIEADTVARKPMAVKYPMVAGIVRKIQAIKTCGATLSQRKIIASIKDDFDSKGPFHFCQAHGLLVNNSGEEFAIQFMSFYNEYTRTNAY